LASTKRTPWIVAIVVIAVLAIGVVIYTRRQSLPEPGTDTYEQTTRAFYHGLAALEVGLLDDARQQFTSATTLVPREPASWANLGLTQMRLGELDAAAEPIQRALSLEPGNSDMALLAARMETARGRLDEGIAGLRRAVNIDTRGLRARFALAEELSRLNTPEADKESQMLLDELAMRAPTNIAIQLERARLAAKLRDAQRLRESVEAIGRDSASWPEQAMQQFAVVQKAATDGNFDDAPRATTILRNVLAPVPAFSESLMAVRTPAELIAEPFDRFLVLASPPSTPSVPDTSLTFTAEPIGAAGGQQMTVAMAFPLNVEGTAALVGADAASARRIDGAPGTWSLPVGKAPGSVPPMGDSIVPLDWNHDFRTDLALCGSGGVSLLLQNEDGTFADVTARAYTGTFPTYDCVSAWPADIEMDGDLDLVVGVREGAPVVLRNNGNGTWQAQQPFAGTFNARAFAWADLDRDADPDAVFVDASGNLHIYINRQNGMFARVADLAGPTNVVSVAVADIDADGAIDVVTLDTMGVVRITSKPGEMWVTREVARWDGLAGASPGGHRLIAADLDNNGALDLMGSGGGQTRIWLADGSHQLQPLGAAAPSGDVFSVVDLNSDGMLDLVGVADGRPTRWLGKGSAGYHWKVIRPRAQQNAGDQRINSFGVGGDIQVRSGLLVQTQVLTGAPLHFGLGTHAAIDVARIVWPNGVAQAEFRGGVDDAIVAEQRLKGSCPWVFAWDGNRMAFVTDFLWRSPLGLRINAQDTAGVTQTEDWVRIAGEQLVPRNGTYDVRITAELWETHFFDHVALLVVDHPADSEVFVDERFSPAHPPSLAVNVMSAVTPVARAWDDHGEDVTDLVTRRDGRYLATFERGAYQGIAKEHFVEFEVPEVRLPPSRDALRRPGKAGTTPADSTLVASGWIYPTDSSINVAIGQGGHVTPSGLALEARVAGQWVTVNPDLGFPAGKNKTMLVDLARVPAQADRLRLRTNLEIYWDMLGVSERRATQIKTTRLQASSAELTFHGYSQTTSPRGDAPETPIYERLANTTQRWRDLVGYYTRFGDVNPLLASVDDRYVIMNAGDELRLRFAEQQPPPTGWRRDFVLIGDGWEKDGDYNTGYSETVLPLPSHDRPDYGAGTPSLTLAHDPIYQRHPEDWIEYHTRFVTPRAFVRGLSRP
jgi:tetratricopeptide (TPR) repeat protein